MSGGLERLAIHTRTTRAWDLATCCARYAAAGVRGVSVWRELVDPAEGGVPPSEAARIIADHGLVVPSLVRAGFFVAPDDGRRAAAVDDARRALDDARVIGAGHVVLVVGADPHVAPDRARGLVHDAIASVAGHAAATGVRLAIEPLHPMYAADRSCVCALREANDLCDALDHPAVGIALDVYHVWWEADLLAEIARAGRAGRLLGLHLCDWRLPLRDPLNDRGLMGDGCIDVRSIAAAADRAGFTGLREVEVFSETYWAMDPDAWLDLVVRRYRERVDP